MKPSVKSTLTMLLIACVLVHSSEERLQSQTLLSFQSGFQQAVDAVRRKDNSIIGGIQHKGKNGTRYNTTFQVLGMKTDVFVSNSDLEPAVSFESTDMSSNQARDLFKHLKYEIISVLGSAFSVTNHQDEYDFDGPFVHVSLSLDPGDASIPAGVQVQIIHAGV